MSILKLYKETGLSGKLLFISFILLVVATALFNRLSADDLFFVYRIKQVGVVGCIDGQYSRVAAYFLNACLIALNSRIVFVLYSLFSLFVFLKLLYDVCDKLLWYKRKQGSVLSVIFVLFAFFCVSVPSDLFFWYTQVSTYLWCLNLLLFITLVLKNHYNKIFSSIVFLPACLLAGSFSEFLSLQFVVLIVAGIVSRRITVRGNKIALSIGAILFLLSMLLTFFSPGLAIRSKLVIHPALSEVFVLNAKYFLLHFKRFFEIKHLLLFILFACWFISKGAQSSSAQSYSWKFFFFAMLFLFFSLLPLTYSTADLAPARALIICDLFFLFAAAELALWAGQKWKNYFADIRATSIIELMLCFVCVYFSYEAWKYAQAYDKREALLKPASTDPLVPEQLPDAYFIHSNKLSADSTFFANQQLRMAHELKQQIVVSGGE